MIARLQLVVLGLTLNACASWVGDRNQIISAFVSEFKIENPSSARFRVTRCSEKDFGKNFECKDALSSGEIYSEACNEDKRLEKCEFIVHYQYSGCYFPTKGIRECDNRECKYIFSKHGLGVCN